MKTIIIAMISILNITFAGEITGVGQRALSVLENSQMSIPSLRQRGMKVQLGEVTGIGKRINLDRIEMIVSAKKVYKMRDLSHIEYRNPSEAKSLKDVHHLEFNNEKLKIKDIGAIIYE